MHDEITGELKTAVQESAFTRSTDHAFLQISGSDATRWLNGMVTNSIQALQPDEGCYNFLLSAQGRIQGDCTIYRAPGHQASYILETTTDQLEPIQQLLDRFIIMDDVELQPLEGLHGVTLLGRNAPVVLGATESGAYIGQVRPVPGELSLVHPNTTDLLELITTPFWPSIPHFHLFARTNAKLSHFIDVLKASGATQISTENREALRVLEARPRFGTDIRDRDLPQETAQTQALHFAKGCYVGQEIVERIRSRGQVHRQFTPFRLDGAPPAAFPAPLEANGKPAGELTSAAPVTTTEGEVWLALGYARREFLESHAPFIYTGGTAHPRRAGELS